MSSKVATVKEVVKETLVGHKEPESEKLSTQTKARFTKHAVPDAETGELFLGHEEFIEAVAPPEEDYVSQSTLPGRSSGDPED
jgi:solute carrier family 25 aspartate/glutamate transporter 12/13